MDWKNYLKGFKKQASPKKVPSKHKYLPVLTVILLVLLAIFLYGLISAKKEQIKTQKLAVEVAMQEKTAEPAIVKVVQVEKRDFEDVLPAIGTIRGYVEFDLKFEVNGVIDKFNFKNGNKVQQGQIIAFLDQRDPTVRYNYAKIKLEEMKKLYEIGAIIESKLKQSELEEELAKIELEKTELKAPFDGIINNREAETGKFVTSNDRVATFSSIDEVVAEIGIIEKDIEKIKLGQRAIVKVDAYPNIEFEGEVDNIASSFEGKSRTLTVKIRIPNPDELLLPGMFARVVIHIYDKKDALVLPITALEKKEEEYLVFIVENNETAKERKVKAGHISTENAVIDSGLSEGEFVVFERSRDLLDGDAVKVIKE
ncbi:MAG: efflux RND transporter periplasmic adaptor subunit [Candidatus Omnitrophota bacterium]